MKTDPKKLEIRFTNNSKGAEVRILRVDGNPLTVLDVVNSLSEVSANVANAMRTASLAKQTELTFSMGDNVEAAPLPFMDKPAGQ